MVQKFIRAVIVAPGDDDEGNIDTGNGDDFTLDIGNNDLAFRGIISKLRDIANSIRGSSRRWKLFEQACRSCKITPATIPQDVAIRWNSTFCMLQHSIYLKRPIRRYVDNLGDPFEQLVLTERKWQQAEVLLLFLLPFQRCTSRFKSNNTTPEIDYVFFAYDMLYNHIDDVKDKLRSGSGLRALHCAPFMLTAIEQMETVLRKYYEKIHFPTVYGDAMILNPRVKLSIFHEETWKDTSAEEYSSACRKRFVEQCSQHLVPRTTNCAVVIPAKRYPPVGNDDEEYERYKQQCLSLRNTQPRNEYDRYIEIPNDDDIKSSLIWWRDNAAAYSDLAKMARDVLAVPASGCSIQRQFSISGRIAIWQQSRLSPRTISNAIIYKAAVARKGEPLPDVQVAGADDLSIEERIGTIPREWMQNWWLEKLDKIETSVETLEIFGTVSSEEDCEDL